MTLALDSNHDLYVGNRNGVAIAIGADEVVQGVKTRLLLFRGEWWLNTAAGTGWFETVFSGAGQDVRRVEREIKRQILASPGVDTLTAFSISYDRATRSITITFEVDTIYGPSGIVEVSA